MWTLPILAILGALSTSVSAHGYVDTLTISGETYTGYQPYSDPYYPTPPPRIVRKVPGNGPVEDITSVDIQCNGWQNSGSAPAPLSAPVKAGETISLQWTTWPDSVCPPAGGLPSISL